MNSFFEHSNPTETAQDRAYQSIKQSIITLERKPGQPLRALEIAQSLDLSRTPVREALSRLQQEGLAQRDQGWGYVVRAMTQKEIGDLFNLRELLETAAAVEALAFLDVAQFDALADTLQRSRQALKLKNLTVARSLNREFRLSVAYASRNSLLYQILLTINDRVTWLGSMHMQRRPERVEEAMRENEAILQALRGGDAGAVRRAVLVHIKNARKGILTDVAPFL